jgi:hypothetical protein
MPYRMGCEERVEILLAHCALAYFGSKVLILSMESDFLPVFGPISLVPSRIPFREPADLELAPFILCKNEGPFE